MELKIEIDLTPVEAAIKKFPEAARQGARLPMLAWQGGMVSEFVKTRLNGREGAMGLNVRTGRTLRGNLIGSSGSPEITASDANPRIGFESRVGFFDAEAARIATVHELGTVGKGGSLPDIKPKRFKFLWVPVTAAVRKYDAPLLAWADNSGFTAWRPKPKKKKGKRRSASRTGQQFILLRKASIPPRLGWREIQKKWVDALPEYAAKIPATIAKKIVEAVKAGQR